MTPRAKLAVGGVVVVGTLAALFATSKTAKAAMNETVPVPTSGDDAQAAQAGPTSQQLLNVWKGKVNTALSVCEHAANAKIAVDFAQDEFDISYQSGSFEDNQLTYQTLIAAQAELVKANANCAIANGAAMTAMRNYEASL